MKCFPPSSNYHKYIIVVIDYLPKLVNVMPKFDNTSHMTSFFIFNHVITCFGVYK